MLGVFFGLWVSCGSGCCMRVLGLVLIGLVRFFFLWVSFG
jgi:hypothetical protein